MHLLGVVTGHWLVYCFS